ncbi:MAG: hypothetical protein WED01_11975 [Candidatus Rokuibacteriota bacterium]
MADITNLRDVKRTKSGVAARQRFVDSAVADGYPDRAVYRPTMKPRFC